MRRAHLWQHAQELINRVVRGAERRCWDSASDLKGKNTYHGNESFDLIVKPLDYIVFHIYIKVAK